MHFLVCGFVLNAIPVCKDVWVPQHSMNWCARLVLSFCPIISQYPPLLLSQNHIHLHIFFCHPCYHLRFPILIVHHPNDGGLKTLMVGNQLLAGRPDPDQQCLSADDSKTPPLQIDCTLDSADEETVSQYVTIWNYRVGSGSEFSVAQLSTWLWRSSLMWWWQRWG